MQIFVTGGVVSSLGKGITAASLGRLLVSRGFQVVLQKLDPYLNIDPGTLNPLEHGEVFVTADGAEVDLDFGHYERFCGVELTRASSVTAGLVYQTVLGRERRGEYAGKTVQVVPHVTDEITRRIFALHTDDVDVAITEIGGTVGDIESLPFLEAARQVRWQLGEESVAFVHVTLVPTMPNGEQKTKPTQHSVAELQARGIAPDVIVARCDGPLDEGAASKIAALCGVPRRRVIPAVNEANLYRIPLSMHDGGLDTEVVARLGLVAPGEEDTPHLDGMGGPGDARSRLEAALAHWRSVIEQFELDGPVVRCGIVGKYAGPDAYLSVAESLRHAAGRVGVRIEVVNVDAEALAEGRRGETVPLAEMDAKVAELGGLDAVVVPGGFGERGFEGKVAALHWARERGVPALGLCLGMQVMVVEAARSLCNLPDAHSREFDGETLHAVVDLLAEQHDVSELGGTMRLGMHTAELVAGTTAQRWYGADEVHERHRHRYAMNPAYQGVLAAAGLTVSGRSDDGRTAELVEVSGHPFYVATQAHPEFTSRPDAPHPLFVGLLSVAGDMA